MLKQLPVYAGQYVTLRQVWSSFQELLDQDLEDCIDTGFQKLDIHNERQISIGVLKQALLSSMRLHTKKSLKVVTKQLMRQLNDSFSLKSYSEQSFRGFILSCLRPDRLKNHQTNLDKIGDAYCNDGFGPSDAKEFIEDLDYFIGGKGAAPQARPQTHVPATVGFLESTEVAQVSNRSHQQPNQYINTKAKTKKGGKGKLIKGILKKSSSLENHIFQ